ncbi:hypothetical protein C0Q70_15853 [Pomacea canaliculata]|uniref:Egal-1 winged helix domain-containing protein n=1 Tax=Pomacea canaliculata TaxID=400727 RepID=A0A2T7NW03_POMCA|nr:uncharacterized protein LOC112572508 [Pomacea canaliculata]XP_025108004.1 uncharacterized protein LOC112572508 [Pomacea canaliculata]PVD25353.1 hypothetical protein C0Q70_15853 [Pomacea canaliculata]
MADDPGHKAMLYFLEILMYSNTPMTISQLAGRFGSRNFSQEMRQSAGGNEAGLRKFLLKYPSLFTVSGNLVSLNDGTAPLGGNFRESSPASSSNHSLPDVSTETEAVQYFRAKLLKKGEKWMPVKSLAGHLSQASPEIRECVGPQNEFQAWLIRHPLIFEVKDDLVCLKDSIRGNMADSSSDTREEFLLPGTDRANLQSLPIQHTPKIKRRPKSLEVREARPTLSQAKVAAAVTASGKPGPITMTANEYKAVMFIKSVIDKKGDMKINSLSGHFSQAPESLRNTIGWSKPELERFIQSHSNIFTISEDETVSVIKNTRLNVIITGSRPQAQNKPTVVNREGKIFHVAKLWGIIDLGKHEHVFIDRTIFGKHIDDLNKLLKVGEVVRFDAIPAPKGSRARWRATKVWKENESIEDLIEKVAAKLDLSLDGIPHEPDTPMGSMNEEIRKIYPDLDDSSEPNSATTPLNIGGINYAFSDAAPSGAGVVPVWNFHHAELAGMKDPDDICNSDDEEVLPHLSMVAERHIMNRSVLTDSPRSLRDSACSNGGEIAPMTLSPVNVTACRKKMVTVSCQTIVTGEILATQLFHEDISV